MIFSFQGIHSFLERFTTCPCLHDEEQAPSYFSCIEGDDSDVFIFELSKTVKVIFESEEELIYLLESKTHKSCLAYSIYEVCISIISIT